MLLRLEYSSEKEFKRTVDGFVGGVWGLIDYKNAQKHKQTEANSIISCCSVKHKRQAANKGSASAPKLVKGGKNIS